MKQTLIIAAIAVLLSACGEEPLPSEEALAADSDSCRSDAQLQLPVRRGVVALPDNNVEVAVYAKNYRSCMNAKGYDLSN